MCATRWNNSVTFSCFAAVKSIQVAGGTFSELNAVAVYLASQDKLGEAEACLTDAILTTMGAYRMLSDIATVNGQFGRAAGIAEMIDTLANTGACEHNII